MKLNKDVWVDYFCCWTCEGVTAFSVWQTDSGIEYGHNMHRLSSQYAQNMLIMWKWMMIEYGSIVTYDDIILSRICSYCDSMCLYHDLIDNLKICLDQTVKSFLKAFQIHIFEFGLPATVFSDLGCYILYI